MICQPPPPFKPAAARLVSARGDRYSYAGWSTSPARRGVAGTLSLDRVDDPGRHVAVWLGVDGSSNGRAVWLQTGIEQEPQDESPRMYVEVVEPGRARRFLDLGPITPGQRLRFQVVRSADGWRAITPRGTFGPFKIPAGDAIVTAEALSGSIAQATASRVRFAGKRGVWHRPPRSLVELDDAGWDLRRRGDGFAAEVTSRRAQPQP